MDSFLRHSINVFWLFRGKKTIHQMESIHNIGTQNTEMKKKKKEKTNTDCLYSFRTRCHVRPGQHLQAWDGKNDGVTLGWSHCFIHVSLSMCLGQTWVGEFTPVSSDFLFTEKRPATKLLTSYGLRFLFAAYF